MAGWKSVEEIVAYQRAVKLRDEITRLTEKGCVARDYKFRADIRGSAASAPSNLSEGFERYRHGEFAHFCRIANSSLGETRNHLVDGRERGYFTKSDVERLDRIADRAMAATVGLIKWLTKSKTPDPYWLCRPTDSPTPPASPQDRSSETHETAREDDSNE